MVNGRERTIPQLRSVFQQAGWKLEKVYAREGASSKRFAVAVPNWSLTLWGPTSRSWYLLCRYFFFADFHFRFGLYSNLSLFIWCMNIYTAIAWTTRSSPSNPVSLNMANLPVELIIDILHNVDLITLLRNRNNLSQKLPIFHSILSQSANLLGEE